MKQFIKKAFSFFLASLMILTCVRVTVFDSPALFVSAESIESDSDAPTTSAVPGSSIIRLEEKDDKFIATVIIQNTSALSALDMKIEYNRERLTLDDYDFAVLGYSERYCFNNMSYSYSNWGSEFEFSASVSGEVYETADITALVLTFSRAARVLRNGAKIKLSSEIDFDGVNSYSSEFTATIPAEKIDPEIYPDAQRSGDIDGDGAVTVSDARHILRLAVDLDRCSETTRQYADADGNDEISVADARLALRVAVAIDTTDVLAYFLPVTEKNDDNHYYYDVDKVALTLTEGEKKTLDDVIVRKDQQVTWTSSNPYAVSVTPNGEITALQKGFSCVILSDGKNSFYYEVTVKNELQNRIDALRNKYPEGYYWNNNPASKKYPAVTEIPCTDHASGAYSKCKGQCAGFSYLLSSEVFGGAKRKFGVTWDTVKIGDYLRLKPHHSVFVIDSVKRGEVIGYDYYEGLNITADSSFVRVVHCNWDMQCGIRWDDYFSCDSYDLDSSQSFTMY